MLLLTYVGVRLKIAMFAVFVLIVSWHANGSNIYARSPWLTRLMRQCSVFLSRREASVVELEGEERAERLETEKRCACACCLCVFVGG